MPVNKTVGAIGISVAGAVAGAWASRILDERSGRAQDGALPPDPGTH